MAREPDEIEDDEIPGQESEELGGDAGRFDNEGGYEAELGAEGEDAEASDGYRPNAKNRVNRYEELSRVAREANDRASRLEQELMAFRAERSQPRQESEAEFEARLQLLDPNEQVRVRLNRAQEENRKQNAIMQMQMADAMDRTQYQTKAQYDSRFKRYEADVEKLRASELAQGRIHSRENLLTYIIGQKALAAQTKVESAKQQARRRVAGQQARPVDSRSDQSRGQRTRLGQGNSLADIEKRLEGVFI
jgi:hypothetical protein